MSDQYGEIKIILDQPIHTVTGIRRSDVGTACYLTEPCQEKLACQIRDALLPQGDDEGLLTPEALNKKFLNLPDWWWSANQLVFDYIRKAQQALTRQEIPEAKEKVIKSKTASIIRAERLDRPDREKIAEIVKVLEMMINEPHEANELEPTLIRYVQALKSKYADNPLP